VQVLCLSLAGIHHQPGDTAAVLAALRAVQRLVYIPYEVNDPFQRFLPLFTRRGLIRQDTSARMGAIGTGLDRQ